MDTQPQFSSLWWKVCDEEVDLSFSPSLLVWMVNVVGWLWVGVACYLFSVVASDDPSGPAPPSLILQMKVRTQMSLCFHKATQAKAS